MFGLNIRKLHAAVLAVALIALSGIGYADDVTESINEAIDSYKEGEYSEAVESLNYASQLIQQMKGESLTSLLPKPLEGWTAEDSTSQAMGAAMYGGGVTAERRYRKGNSRITARIITDSPVMQSMMMMFSNPMFASSDGGKLEKIKRQKAIVKYNPSNKKGDIKIVVKNRFLVLVEGSGTTKEDLKKYAKAINYKKLASMP